jgi:hypothetical protein
MIFELTQNFLLVLLSRNQPISVLKLYLQIRFSAWELIKKTRETSELSDPLGYILIFSNIKMHPVIQSGTFQVLSLYETKWMNQMQATFSTYAQSTNISCVIGYLGSTKTIFNI